MSTVSRRFLSLVPCHLSVASASAFLRLFRFSRRPILRGGILVLLLGNAVAQSTPPVAAQAPTEALRPVLSHISETMAGLNVPRWKAPGEVRSVTQRDIDSIQRDLTSSLPPLMEQANTPPLSVASCFAVYRNLDALYDVLLRVSETATLAGTQDDATNLQTLLASVEASRRNLGDAVLQLASGHEEELGRLRAAAAQAAAAATIVPVTPTKTIVEDGPLPAPKTTAAAKRKKKPVQVPPASAPQ